MIVVTKMTRAMIGAITYAVRQNRLRNRRNQIGPGVFNSHPRPSKQASQPGYMKPNTLKSHR